MKRSFYLRTYIMGLLKNHNTRFRVTCQVVCFSLNLAVFEFKEQKINILKQYKITDFNDFLAGTRLLFSVWKCTQ